jgi:hypothetical protein
MARKNNTNANNNIFIYYGTIEFGYEPEFVGEAISEEVAEEIARHWLCENGVISSEEEELFPYGFGLFGMDKQSYDFLIVFGYSKEECLERLKEEAEIEFGEDWCDEH